MDEFFMVLLTGLLAFMVMDYILGRLVAGNPPKPFVADPLRAVIAAVFAVLLVLIAGVLGLAEVIEIS